MGLHFVCYVWFDSIQVKLLSSFILTNRFALFFTIFFGLIIPCKVLFSQLGLLRYYAPISAVFCVINVLGIFVLNKGKSMSNLDLCITFDMALFTGILSYFICSNITRKKRN